MSQLTEEEVERTTAEAIGLMRAVLATTAHVSLAGVICGAISAAAFIHLKTGVDTSKEKFLELVGENFDAVVKDIQHQKAKLQ